jgi:homogentisate 1,2-dioxygenase
MALYVYTINASMEKRAFCNTDGDFLICAQQGNLDIQTEFGMIFLQSGEICVIQRGVRFRIALGPGVQKARGYISEVWGSMWELPDLGPLGGHSLANPRDFLYPVAHIDEDLSGDWQIVNKNNGKYNCLEQDHSPFDLVAWHGNVVPYKVRMCPLPALRTFLTSSLVRSYQIRFPKRNQHRPHRSFRQHRPDRQISRPQYSSRRLPLVRSKMGCSIQYLPPPLLPQKLRL